MCSSVRRDCYWENHKGVQKAYGPYAATHKTGTDA